MPPSGTLRPIQQADGSFRIPAEQVEALRQFVERSHVNAVQIPHPSEVIKDPEAERDRLRAWLAAFDVVAKELNRDHLANHTKWLEETPRKSHFAHMKTVGLKELHDATGEIVRGVVDRAEEIVILDRGRKVAKLIPYAPSTEPSWGEIMREVWARPRPKETVPNPILAERRRRTYVHRVRR